MNEAIFKPYDKLSDIELARKLYLRGSYLDLESAKRLLRYAMKDKLSGSTEAIVLYNQVISKLEEVAA